MSQLAVLEDLAIIFAVSLVVILLFHRLKLPALPGFSRHTDIVHFGGVGQPNDYKKITVTVSGPGLLAPVSRTVTVAAP